MQDYVNAVLDEMVYLSHILGVQPKDYKDYLDLVYGCDKGAQREMIITTLKNIEAPINNYGELTIDGETIPYRILLATITAQYTKRCRKESYTKALIEDRKLYEEAQVKLEDREQVIATYIKEQFTHLKPAERKKHIKKTIKEDKYCSRYRTAIKGFEAKLRYLEEIRNG